MKLHELFRELRELGWWSTGKGSKHDKWTNGTNTLAVPRHGEVSGRTAYKLVEQAKNFNITGKLVTVFSKG